MGISTGIFGKWREVPVWETSLIGPSDGWLAGAVRKWSPRRSPPGCTPWPGACRVSSH